MTRDGAPVARLAPEKRVYHVQRNPMTEAAIDYGLARHIYVALGDDVGNGAWTVRVHIKPFIGWIWGGCLLMALGGLLAASDRRYRAGSRARGEPRRRRRCDAACASGRGMKRFLIPLAVFVLLVGFLAVGLKLDPREVPSPLVGKPAPAFELPVLQPAGQALRPRRHARQGLAAERLGVLVRVLPRRAPGAGRACRRRACCRSSA